MAQSLAEEAMSYPFAYRLALVRHLYLVKAWQDLHECGACLLSDLDPCWACALPCWHVGTVLYGMG